MSETPVQPESTTVTGGPITRRTLLYTAVSATILAAVLATLHSLAILPLGYETIPITQIQHLEGLTYFAPLTSEPYVVPRFRAEELHENGVRSPFPMTSGYGVIGKSGGGRFHVSASTVFFSAFDNSDPRTNGRQYTIRQPVALPAAVILALWIAAITGGVTLVRQRRDALIAWISHPPFAAVAALLIILIAANRLWLLVDFPIPAIHPDSTSYYALTDQLSRGEWPNFGVRPPGYPLFMRLVFSIDDRVMALIAAQMMLSTLAALTLVYAVSRWQTRLALPAALAMAGYLMSTASMEHDSGMLSESLYSTSLVFAFASLLLGLRGVRPTAWMAASSTVMGLAILTRPAGMFLAVTYLVIVLFMVRNRTRRTVITAFAIPLPVLLLAICIYNSRTIGVFAPSAWGEANLAVGTFTYWETDPSYPAEINDGIVRIRSFVNQRMTETGVSPAILESTWDPVQLSRVFILGFHGTALDVAMRMGGGGYERTGRTWIRRIAFDSIRKRPIVYAKFVYSMLYNYYRPWPESDFRGYVMSRSDVLFVQRRFSRSKGNALMTRVAKELADAAPPPTVVLTNADPAVPIDVGERVLLQPTPGLRLYRMTYALRTWAFSRWLWPLAALLTLLASTVVLAQTRGRSAAAFAAFIMTISLLGASLVISLVEYSQPRYSYPMEWTYFIAPLFVPLLVARRPLPVRQAEPARA
jgi:hypothetical protein